MTGYISRQDVGAQWMAPLRWSVGYVTGYISRQGVGAQWMAPLREPQRYTGYRVGHISGYRTWGAIYLPHKLIRKPRTTATLLT